ncbi:quinone oxidoreductase family protein [Microlunatus soli]|uniref:NADPH:quinone reductase n=1 Tax=Microlunatus soli TaxID=630515 RepID=A0A1H1R9V5_9ACTN|nr:zinc-binding alcohol dehydrogenase family protein [Microlunatus soli]SDS32574.1 NADPH:quinone reductase [Microlunatus soli]
MKAALITDTSQPPRYTDFADPEPAAGEESVTMLAAGLHQITRAQASGQHYASPDRLPMIPGVDGVARRDDGSLVYCGGLRPPYGTFAERAAIASVAVPLPTDADPTVVAATVNPGMSSWIVYKLRGELQAGQTVAILGATGASGRAAVQAARLLGAGRVIAIGRNADALAEIDADETVRITADGDWAHPLGKVGGDVDLVVDYLWGEPAAQSMEALVTNRSDPARQLSWVQVGSMAGHTLPLNAGFLRAANLHLLGSGLRGVPWSDIAAQLPELIDHIVGGRISVRPVARPLRDIATTWTEAVAPGERIVVVP